MPTVAIASRAVMFQSILAGTEVFRDFFWLQIPALAPRRMPAPRARRCRTSYAPDDSRGRNQVEHYGRDFQMDTAFYIETGFTFRMVFRRSEFLSEGSGNFWLKRVHLYYWAKRGRDEVQDATKDI